MKSLTAMKEMRLKRKNKNLWISRNLKIYEVYPHTIPYFAALSV